MIDTLIQSEKLAVEQFVRKHRDVVATGKINLVSIGSYSFSRDEQLPVRYDVGVNIESRTIYAIVDVDRKATEAVFNLKCITPLSMGRREANRDACAQ